MDWRHGGEMYGAIKDSGLKLINLAVWVKSAGANGGFYRSQHELVFIAKNGSAPHCNNVQMGKHGRYRTNCWHYPGMNSFGKDRAELLAMHPTVKNLAMFADAIRDASNRGDIVFDGFAGSGTTIIAAEKTGRIARCIELDPLYVDCIVRRWEKFSGEPARLGSPDGPTFAEVMTARVREEEHDRSRKPSDDVPVADVDGQLLGTQAPVCGATPPKL
jgi:DNA modification methylase